MSLELHNTLSGRREPFAPLKPGRAGIYLCGPTADGGPHLGHARSAVLFDVLVRYLEARGFSVTYVRNVTDIDDKILAAARREGCDYRRLASRNAERHRRALERLGVRPPAAEPRASDFIPAVCDCIARLIQSGNAYPSGGDVYFAVESFPDYGRLSGRFPAAGAAAGEAAPEGNGSKRRPADFALWKAAREDEPAWPSPWGPGRPGWHIECTAMSTALLGETFDIHGGGIDLLFPHHENEIAQSQSLSGKPPARTWLHHGLVCLRGEKMAKSTGNLLALEEVLAVCAPGALRLFLLSKRYRHPLEFTPEGLRQAENAYARLARFLASRPKAAGGAAGRRGRLWSDFCAAMDADYNTPAALALLFAALREENRAEALSEGTADMDGSERSADIRFICREVLGLPGGEEDGGESASPQGRNL